MKKLKITVLLISLLIVSGTLTACDPASFEYGERNLLENIVVVELIQYDNPAAKSINNFFKKDGSLKGMLPFDFDKMELLETLDETSIENFLKELSEIYVMYHWVHSDSPNGICLRLIYENGDFDVISCYYAGNDNGNLIAKYDETGKVLSYEGLFSGNYEQLIKDYFITHIE